MLKINVDGLVFSSLFDMGAQVSCIKYDTVATLGLATKYHEQLPNTYLITTKTKHQQQWH